MMDKEKLVDLVSFFFLEGDGDEKKLNHLD